MSNVRPSQTIPLDWLSQVFGASGTVLLHTADSVHAGARSLLFTDPVRIISAVTAAEVPQALVDLEEAVASGQYVAGYLTYEAGLALHRLPAHPLPNGEPLLCFGVYRHAEQHSMDGVQAATGDIDPPELDLALMPTVSPANYGAAVATIQRWIADGEIYQANYTFPLRSECRNQPEAIYRAILQQQPSGYAAVCRLSPGPEVLSFTPELFFATDRERNIRTRPMKGTAPRSSEPAGGMQMAGWLSDDPKNRAEHVMIVDLLRNDLGRICETGSIHTRDLFHVESLPTVHQMVSGVHGRLREGTSWTELFSALFPSGSVTGAPKRRAMQRLHQVENTPRGVYTGTIGYIAPGGESCFSVAIRTLTLRNQTHVAEVTCGVGGGIVADSTPAGEYAEALLKAAFIVRASKPLELIETMRGEHGKLRWVDSHLARMERAATALAIPFARDQVLATVQQAAQRVLGDEPQRVRVVFGGPEDRQAAGIASRVNVEKGPLQSWPDTLRVRISAQRTHLGNPALAYKTNFRFNYDSEFHAARQAGFDEALFANDAGLLTEGCVTNLFFVRKGRLFTPYLECGVLPGILREHLLQRGLVAESLLSADALQDCEALLLGNSLRHLYPVHSLEVAPETILTWNTTQTEPLLRSLRSALQTMS